MTDAEFRRRAHDLLVRLDETIRGMDFCGGLDYCGDCTRHGNDHKQGCDFAALLAAGPVETLRESIERGLFRLASGICTCDIVGHAAGCPARRPTLIPVAPVVLGCCDVIGHGPECPVNRRKT